MTTTAEVVYQSGLLADASYVSFDTESFLLQGAVADAAWEQDDADPDRIVTFEDRGFTLQQFVDFSLLYEVIHHQPDTTTGFSATLFRNINTGEYHLAFRGTNDAADYAQDTTLALALANTLGGALQAGVVEDFLRDAGILDAGGSVRPEFIGRINLTGHSLGGFLAIWTAQEHPQLVARVDTFNGAGLAYGVPTSLLLDSLARELLAPGGLDETRIHNFYAEPGLELAATGALAYRPGEHVPLFIENNDPETLDPFVNHSMAHLVDALAAYRLFGALDPALDIAAITSILEGASNRGVGSIATACVALGDALGDPYPGIVDPVTLYAQLRPQLESGAWEGLRIEAVPGSDAATRALEDSIAGNAYRFALTELHSFVLIHPAAASAAPAAELHSAEFWEHRAMLLENLLARNATDAQTLTRFAEDYRRFEDAASGIGFTLVPRPLDVPVNEHDEPLPPGDPAFVRFGAEAAEYLQGATRDDALFGLAGNDTLYGDAGADLLEGGAGADLLLGGEGGDLLRGEAGDDTLIGGPGIDRLEGGAGADTYAFENDGHYNLVAERDSGGDAIVVDQMLLSALNYEATAPGSGVYRNSGAALRFELRVEGGSLLIRCIGSSTGTIALADWRNGDFGIHLPELAMPAAPPAPDGTEYAVTGDRAALDTDPQAPGVQVEYDALGNLRTDPAVIAAGDDTLFGSEGADHIVAGEGRDRVTARAGNDRIEGGPDSDILLGGEGNDLVFADTAAGFAAVLDALTLAGNSRDWLAGGNGNDTLVGAAGGEALSAGAGADLVYGGAGADHLLGDADLVSDSLDWSWSDDAAAQLRSYVPVTGVVDPIDGGADTLHGGTGADWIVAGRGDDLVLGEDGADSAGGGSGNDTLEGGAGDDALHGDASVQALAVALHGDDALDGNAGNDVLVGGGGDDTLGGGDDDDQLYGDAADIAAHEGGDDLLDGGAGNDTLSGAGGADVISGGNGADVVSADGGADTVDGGDGDDRLWGDSSSLVAEDEGDDLVAGGAGHDQLVGGGGADTLQGGSGEDSLWGAAGEDLLQGDAGADELAGADGNDTLAGGDEADVLWGEAGDDVLVGGRGDDTLQGGQDADSLRGGDGTDVLLGEQGADALQGGAGADELGGGDGADTLFGGEGGDLVYGDADADSLNGGAGADRLYGDAGADTLDGGRDGERDTLYGGAGNDTYVLRPGGGDDLLVDTEGSNTLQFAGVTNPGAIAVVTPAGSSSVTLQFAGGSLQMDLAQYRALVDLGTDSGAVSGAELVHATASGDYVLLPATADTLHARAGADTVAGGAGNDLLHGEAGNDLLRGEAGADTLFGGDGAEYLFGGSGDDALSGDSGDDIQMGDDGNDLLDGGTGRDTLDGGAGNDTLSGGEGDDSLSGNAGSDIVLIGAGAGNDVLAAQWPAAGELDTVRFGSGIDPGTILLRNHGSNDLYLEQPDGQALRVQGFFTYPDNPPRMEFRFDDAPGTVWTVADITARFATAASEGDDLIDGFGRDDLLDGLGGNDALNGWDGNDTLIGAAGRDTLDGGNGDDSLAGGAEADELRGMDGRDTLAGGGGADTLRGGAGEDTYHYAPGDGDDTIVELDGMAVGAAYVDVLQFGTGIAPASVSASPLLRDPTGYIAGGALAWSDLETVLHVGAATISILDPEFLTDYYARIDELRFADAPQTVVSWNELHTQMSILDDGADFAPGSVGNDVLDARGGADILSGAGGNDSLIGGAGNDTLVGGKGSDTLVGGAGDDFLRGGDDPDPGSASGDRYLWGRGAGRDTIQARPDSAFWVDASGNAWAADSLQLEGVAWSELRAAREGDDLALWVDADRVTVLQYFQSGHNQVRILDAGGTGYGLAAVERKISDTAMLAQVSSGDDQVVGTEQYGDGVDALAGNDVVDGRGGDDSLAGGEGNDLLLGQGGNDTLAGGNGADTLAGGAGTDQLAGGAGSDTYRFGFGDGADRILDQDKSSGRYDTVLMQPGVRADDVRISRGADDLVLILADSGETLTIAKHFTVKGKDVGYHVDAVRFADGTLWTRADIDQWQARSSFGHYTLTGTAGADTLVALGGNDTLAGEAGNDTLSAGAGDDFIRGGTGNDLLEGGKGADIYEFLAGDGNDLLVDSDTGTRTDRLQLGAGILPAAVTAWRAGTADLVLLLGGADAVRVRDFFAEGTAPGRGIEVIRFADGTQWTRADLQTAPPMSGNSAPLAADDAAVTLVDKPLTLSAAALLANDTDLDGDTLTLTGVQPGAAGSVTLDPIAGTILFTPERYFSGQAWFTSTVSDGLATATARVDVRVDIDTGGNARLGTAGADALAGTRNDDRLYGLGGDDSLRADRGNDLLSGGAGNDTLEGAAGNDTYVFQRGEGQDLLDNRSARATDVDSLWLTGGIAREELWFLREGNDLLIGTASPAERLTIDEWFGSAEARIDEIHVGGEVLYAAEVDRLAQAMAVFDAPRGAGFLQGDEGMIAAEPLLAGARESRWSGRW